MCRAQPKTSPRRSCSTCGAGPERFDPDRGELRPWLATLTHNRSGDWLRHELATRRRDQRDLREASTPPVDVDERVQVSMTAQRIRLAVAALPQSQGVPIGLAYLVGRSYRQVAQDLGLPEGTIKSRIRKGLRRLSVIMATEMAEVGAWAEAAKST